MQQTVYRYISQGSVDYPLYQNEYWERSWMFVLYIWGSQKRNSASKTRGEDSNEPRRETLQLESCQ